MHAEPGTRCGADALRQNVVATIVFFLLIFSIEFLLGPARVLVFEPMLGQRSARLIEAPVLVVEMVIAARCVAGWFNVPVRMPELTITGMSAVAAADILMGRLFE